VNGADIWTAAKTKMDDIAQRLHSSKPHSSYILVHKSQLGDTGGLLGNDWSTWDEAKYALLKPALWQTKDGKFIGLDHKIPLGSKGISLGEYYGTPQASDPPATRLRRLQSLQLHRLLHLFTATLTAM